MSSNDAPVLDLSSRFSVTVAELAEALGVSRRFIRDHQADIPHVWIGKRILFPVDQVREWLRERAETERSAAEGVAEEIMKDLTDV